MTLEGRPQPRGGWPDRALLVRADGEGMTLAPDAGSSIRFRRHPAPQG